LLLTYLDDLPAQTAAIATSNRDMRALSDRFDTRFTPIEVKSPTDSEIADFLVKQWCVPRKAADFIAIGACGNVRDAFLRAANFLILGDVTERPEAKPQFHRQIQNSRCPCGLAKFAQRENQHRCKEFMRNNKTRLLARTST